MRIIKTSDFRMNIGMSSKIIISNNSLGIISRILLGIFHSSRVILAIKRTNILSYCSLISEY